MPRSDWSVSNTIRSGKSSTILITSGFSKGEFSKYD
jgi:hypothetical protein